MTDLPPITVIPTELLAHPLTPSELRVLIGLYSFRGKDTNTVWPSLEALSQRVGVKDKTQISKITTILHKKGFLEKKKSSFNGNNRYKLMIPNLEEGTKLEELPNQEETTIPNLGKTTNSNLGKTTKDKHIKEQTKEQTNIYVSVSGYWNEKLGSLGKTKFLKWSKTRKTHFKSRVRDDKLRDLDWWKNLIDDIPNHVQAMSSDWFDLDWLIKSEDNLIKFLEGKYKNPFSKLSGVSGEKKLTMVQRASRWANEN